MKQLYILLTILVAFGCNQGPSQQSGKGNDGESGVKTVREEPLPEGLRNRRGYPIGTVEQAQQLLDGVGAKRSEIARRMADFIKDPSKAEVIKEVSASMEVLRPKLDRYQDITAKIISGEAVDFLSEQDLGKVQYRQQTLLDALIDSLSYINSLYDQVLVKSDVILMEKMKADQ